MILITSDWRAPFSWKGASARTTATRHRELRPQWLRLPRCQAVVNLQIFPPSDLMSTYRLDKDVRCCRYA